MVFQAALIEEQQASGQDCWIREMPGNGISYPMAGEFICSGMGPRCRHCFVLFGRRFFQGGASDDRGGSNNFLLEFNGVFFFRDRIEINIGRIFS